MKDNRFKIGDEVTFIDDKQYNHKFFKETIKVKPLIIEEVDYKGSYSVYDYHMRGDAGMLYGVMENELALVKSAMTNSNDYIVCTESHSPSYIVDYIYKVKRWYSDISFSTVIDSESSITNGWTMKFFRHATPEEASMYESAGGPVYIKSFSSDKKNLPEKWCVQVTSYNIDAIGKWRDKGILAASSRGYVSNIITNTSIPGKNIVGYYHDDIPDEYELVSYDRVKHIVEPSSKPSLPKKWCVKVDEKNIHAINNWRTIGVIHNPLGYIVNESHGKTKGYHYNHRPAGYELVSYDEVRHIIEYPSPVPSYSAEVDPYHQTIHKIPPLPPPVISTETKSKPELVSSLDTHIKPLKIRGKKRLKLS